MHTWIPAQVSVDTACSSALVGSHAAAQHLGKHGGSALSAGVNLMLSERTTAATQIAGVLCYHMRIRIHCHICLQICIQVQAID